MRNTNYVFLQGKCKWARLATVDTYGNFKITLYPDEASLAKIKELQAGGIKNILKRDDEGYNMTFRRPQNKMIKGKVVGLAPVEVLGKDNRPLKELVGNDSDVTVKLETYKYKSPLGDQGMAARLLSVRVDDLVPYNRDTDFTPQEKLMIEGLPEQPKQVDVW